MALLGEIGTLAWARRTNGVLGRGERARVIAAVTLSQLRNTPELLTGKLRGLGGVGPDPSKLTPPDSELAKETVALCEETLEPSVVAHSIRSYIFSRALGYARGIEADPEELFVATMLHDWGFCELEELTDRCFTVVGAEQALELAEGAGWATEAAERTAESITLHINPEVGREQGDTQHLVHDGVFLDVFAIGASELDREGLRRVYERYPRAGFLELAKGMLSRHSELAPGCRINATFQAGFGLALGLAPR